MALFSELRSDRDAVQALLERVRVERPDLWRAVGWAQPEQVRERIEKKKKAI